MPKVQQARVAVYGESLIDLIQQDDGSFRAALGGSPYNVARALGLQAVPVSYLTPLAQDSMGQRLSRYLDQAGVQSCAPTSSLPCSLALVSLDQNSSPQYSLYRTGVADRDIGIDDLIACAPEQIAIFHCGSLVLIPDEIDKTLALVKHLRGCQPRPLICVDINMRPLVVGDVKAYANAVARIFAHADIVKLSDEDLRSLPFGNKAQTAAQAIATDMNDGAVIVTLGARGCLMRIKDQSWELKPPLPVDVVDSIGAGDCFQAGLLAWLYEFGKHSPEELHALDSQQWRACLSRASLTATHNLGQTGCQPPTRTQIIKLAEQCDCRSIV